MFSQDRFAFPYSLRPPLNNPQASYYPRGPRAAYYFSMGGLQIADETRAYAEGPGLKNKLAAMLRAGLEKLRIFVPRARDSFPSRKEETNMAESYVKKELVVGWWRGEVGSVMEPIVYDDGDPRNGVHLAFLDEENEQPKLTLPAPPGTWLVSSARIKDLDDVFGSTEHVLGYEFRGVASPDWEKLELERWVAFSRELRQSRQLLESEETP